MATTEKISPRALHQRLNREGRFEHYRAVRQRLIRGGMHQKYAWRVAGAYFVPDDGGPLEYSIAGIEKLIEDTRRQYGEALLAPPHLATPTTTEITDQQLVELSMRVPADRKAQPIAVLNWVHCNILTPLAEFTADQIPDRGALSLLQWVRADLKNRTEFYKAMWIKTLPSEKELADSARFTDDNRPLHELLDTFATSIRGDQ